MRQKCIFHEICNCTNMRIVVFKFVLSQNIIFIISKIDVSEIGVLFYELLRLETVNFAINIRSLCSNRVTTFLYFSKYLSAPLPI